MRAEATDLLDLVYEAAVIPERWPEVIERLGSPDKDSGGALLTVAGGVMQYLTTKRLERPFARYMAERDFDLNVRPGRFLARRHHGFLRDVDLCTIEELASDPIYSRYLRPAGFGWTVGTILPVPGGDTLIFEIARRPELGPYDRGFVARLDSYRPHLARSAHLAARLGLKQAQSVAATLSVVGLPAAVMRADKRVVAVNGQFEALAPRIDTTAQDRLIVKDPNADSLLQAELEKTSPADTPLVRSIPVPASEGCPPFVVHLTPVRREARDIFGQAHWIAIVTEVVADGTMPDAGILQGLFDLTAAEARVARNLLEGATASHIARTNEVSITTVRSHIQSILSKTGVSRQVDLIHLLGGIAIRDT